MDETMNHVIESLNSRGVTIDDLAELVMFLQTKYVPDLSEADCKAALLRVLSKREVQYCVLTAIALDKCAYNHTMDDPIIESIIDSDAPLYGLDEVVAYAICNLYGSIALTNFGYIDKVKPGIIAKLNDANHNNVCNTFLDDIAGALAAAAAASIAHDYQKD